MSCREKRRGDALRLCTDILLCREEYAGKYEELRSLVGSSQVSAHVTGFFKRAFAFEQFTTARSEWEDKLAEVDVLDLLERRKLNHEEFDYVTTVLKRVSRNKTKKTRNKKPYIKNYATPDRPPPAAVMLP